MSANKVLDENRNRAGRPKGSLNKTTKLVKDAIAFAANELGGAQRLADWARESQENERAFWVQVYPKLLPLQVTGEDGGALQHSVTINVRGIEPKP